MWYGIGNELCFRYHIVKKHKGEYKTPRIESYGRSIRSKFGYIYMR